MDISEPALSGDQPANSECTWCERAPGLLVLAAAGIMGYIGLDLLTGGRLTGWAAGLFGAAAAAVPDVAPVTAAADSAPLVPAGQAGGVNGDSPA